MVKDPKQDLIPDDMFDEKLIHESPILALEFVQKGILYMGSIVKDYMTLAKSYSLKEDSALVNEAFTFEMMLIVMIKNSMTI